MKPENPSNLTGPLAEALKRGRDGFNARFAVARKARPIDAEAFLAHLAHVVAPIVDAVAARFSEKVDQVTSELYDLSLELIGSSVIGPGSKSQGVAQAWRALLPRAPHLMAREPGRVAACVTNAVYNLQTSVSPRADEWLTIMQAIVPSCAAVQPFLDAGKVAAWRCGLAQYRAGALAVARQMDAALAAGALGLPTSTEAAALRLALDRMAGNPWLTPTEALSGAGDPKRLRLVRRAGAFRGFGGPFLRPPVVAFADGQWLASDGETTFGLIADVFGEHFFRLDQPAPAVTGTMKSVVIDSSGAVQWGQAAARWEALTARSSLATDEVTLAVTLPTSHHVFLLARG